MLVCGADLAPASTLTHLQLIQDNQLPHLDPVKIGWPSPRWRPPRGNISAPENCVSELLASSPLPLPMFLHVLTW